MVMFAVLALMVQSAANAKSGFKRGYGRVLPKRALAFDA
jgi:hypothetical protein